MTMVVVKVKQINIKIILTVQAISDNLKFCFKIKNILNLKYFQKNKPLILIFEMALF
jgi:hypothetical protein